VTDLEKDNAKLRERLMAAEARADRAERLLEAQAIQLRHLTALVQRLKRRLAELLPPSEDDTDSDDEPKATGEGWQPRLRDDRRASKRNGKPRRRPLPEHLERDTHEIEEPCCPHCGSDDLEAIGVEVTEQLDHQKPRVRVRRIERRKVKCRSCRKMSTARMPPTAVPQGSMTPAFLAHIVNQKCGLHLPLQRIIEDLAHLGISLAKSTMCDAFGHAANLYQPVHDQLVREEIFEVDLVHTDGTGLDTLTPGKGGKKYRGQVFAYATDRATLYQYAPSKHGEHIRAFLRAGTPDSYQGYLVADAGSNMDVLYKDGQITECGCWYHARKRFADAASSAPALAEEAKTWIRMLFDVEHEADDAGDTAVERLARRHIRSRPIVDHFYQWMAEQEHTVDLAEPIAKAIAYFTHHKAPLLRFLEDGRIPLTNNLVERELGVIGRGRKAYLFAGSSAGGERLAILYTAVRTCQRIGIDPYEYLADVLPKLSVMEANRGINAADLTPRAWQAARAPPA
jgi:transposase